MGPGRQRPPHDGREGGIIAGIARHLNPSPRQLTVMRKSRVRLFKKERLSVFRYHSVWAASGAGSLQEPLRLPKGATLHPNAKRSRSVRGESRPVPIAARRTKRQLIPLLGAVHGAQLLQGPSLPDFWKPLSFQISHGMAPPGVLIATGHLSVGQNQTTGLYAPARSTLGR